MSRVKVPKLMSIKGCSEVVEMEERMEFLIEVVDWKAVIMEMLGIE